MDKIVLIGIIIVCLCLGGVIITFPLQVIKREKNAEKNYLKYGCLIVNNSQKSKICRH